MEGLIAVLGATGAVGSRVVRKLVAKKANVRAVARDPSKGNFPDGVEQVAADLTKPEDAKRAVEGAAIVYFTPPLGGENPDRDELAATRNVAAAAKEAGVKHLLAHTALQADIGKGSELLETKQKVDATITGAGVPYTVLRPGFFMQNLFGAKEYIDQGMLSMPITGDRKIGMISVEDIATAAVGFIEKGPQNRGFDMHVPGGVACDGLCSDLAAARGEPVNFQQFEGATTDYVQGYPISARHKVLFASLFDHFQRADYLGSPEQIKSALPGFEYTAAADFAKQELYAAAPAPAQ